METISQVYFEVDKNCQVRIKNLALTKVYLMTIGLHILYLVNDTT